MLDQVTKQMLGMNESSCGATLASSLSSNEWFSNTDPSVFIEFLRSCLELGGGKVAKYSGKLYQKGSVPLQTQPYSIRFNCFMY